MSPDPLEILDGALLVSDAHYSGRRPELEGFLAAVQSGELACSQLILMGDIFDLLFGQVAISKARNKRMIALINAISERLPVLYLEGNHDYNLDALFPHVSVFALVRQPVECRFAERKLYLAHGDFNQPLLYRIYTAIIRNPLVMKLLGWIDAHTQNAIINRLDRYLDQKNDCYEIPEFCTFVRRHVMPAGLPGGSCLIEGHYHQGVRCNLEGIDYFNLGAFACGGEYAMIVHEDGAPSLRKYYWREGRSA